MYIYVSPLPPLPSAPPTRAAGIVDLKERRLHDAIILPVQVPLPPRPLDMPRRLGRLVGGGLAGVEGLMAPTLAAPHGRHPQVRAARVEQHLHQIGGGLEETRVYWGLGEVGML